MKSAARQFVAQPAAALRSHPLPTLLVVEWLLLLLNLFELIHFPYLDLALYLEEPGVALPWIEFPPFATLGFFFLFAGLGCWIPVQKSWHRIAYTVAEFALLSFASLSLDQCWSCFSLSLIVVVLRSCVMFSLPGRMLTAGLIFALSTFSELVIFWNNREELVVEIWEDFDLMEQVDLLPRQELSSFLLREQLQSTLYFSMVLVFVLLLTHALTAERQGKKHLANAHEQLRQYALRIENQATVEERNRIAREIHDSLGHLLTTQKIQINNALAFFPNEPDAAKSRAFLVEGKALGVEALQELRRSLKMLRSDPFQNQSLEQLLQQLATKFSQDMGLKIACQIQLGSPISDEVKRAVYRIVEESLNNAYKHSEASRVNIQIQTDAVSQMLQLGVVDDGKGFTVSQNTSGFGLRGMQERAIALGGQLKIESEPGTGCQISGQFPLGLAVKPASNPEVES